MIEVLSSIVTVYGLSLLFFLINLHPGDGSDDARRLYYDLLKGRQYNKLIRPVGNSSDKLTVRMGIRLSQLIDIVSSFLTSLTIA